MIRYLIQRPIAVLTVCVALIAAGFFIIPLIPVSLLPEADVPEILIKVNYSNVPAPMLDQNIVKAIRDNLGNLRGLKSIESVTANHVATVHLTFEHGTAMNLAYMDVNEKIDKLSNTFPRDMPRPQIMRVNTADIPIIRLQVIPRSADNFAAISALTDKVIKRRLEQIEGVSLVDINGLQQSIISVTPVPDRLLAAGITETAITAAIRNANYEVGNLSIRDMQYRYFVKVTNNLNGIAALTELPILLRSGTVARLGQFATVQEVAEPPTGYHLFNGNNGIVVTIQETPTSRMNEVVPAIEKVVTQFKKDYPQATFSLTQDQTFLLTAGISNLEQDIIYGGILTILLLFLFLGNWRAPLLMSINIPLSLVITFFFFYLFGISFNIISLSGLALGIGMLIDNSIVVVDSITRKNMRGLSTLESACTGVQEVATPVISQVLTTVAVYAPLIVLGGVAGLLILEQSIALTISLFVSLLIAFILTPLLYNLVHKGDAGRYQEDTRLYKAISRGYHRMIHHILQHHSIYFLVTLLIMPLGIILITFLPVSYLPVIEKKESLVTIDWNTAVDVQENLRRTKELISQIQSRCLITESEVGIKQFVLQQDNSSTQKTDLYYSCSSEAAKLAVDSLLTGVLRNNYPAATFGIMDAPNAFTQLFNNKQPYFEARFKQAESLPPDSLMKAIPLALKMANITHYESGLGFVMQPSYQITLDYNKLSLYGISQEQVEDKLHQLFGAYTIAEIKRFSDIRTIRLNSTEQNMQEKLNTSVATPDGANYPLREFVDLYRSIQPRFITADKRGQYESIILTAPLRNVDQLMSSIRRSAAAAGLDVDFRGQYFENIILFRQLLIIFIIVCILLFIILAIQYENFIDPIIVMLTIPIGITGATSLLLLAGGSLDVMAGIGFMVILGLIVDDPILKIETIRQLEKQYRQPGIVFDKKLLEKIIHEAGDICLKPMLMVSLTTSVALVPVLLVSGIGNDLQKPLAFVIIGGLSIGTFFTSWFVPLAYWYKIRIIEKFRRKSSYKTVYP